MKIPVRSTRTYDYRLYVFRNSVVAAYDCMNQKSYDILSAVDCHMHSRTRIEKGSPTRRGGAWLFSPLGMRMAAFLAGGCSGPQMDHSQRLAVLLQESTHTSELQLQETFRPLTRACLYPVLPTQAMSRGEKVQPVHCICSGPGFARAARRPTFSFPCSLRLYLALAALPLFPCGPRFFASRPGLPLAGCFIHFSGVRRLRDMPRCQAPSPLAQTFPLRAHNVLNLKAILSNTTSCILSAPPPVLTTLPTK